MDERSRRSIGWGEGCRSVARASQSECPASRREGKRTPIAGRYVPVRSQERPALRGSWNSLDRSTVAASREPSLVALSSRIRSLASGNLGRAIPHRLRKVTESRSADRSLLPLFLEQRPGRPGAIASLRPAIGSVWQEKRTTSIVRSGSTRSDGKVLRTDDREASGAFPIKTD